MLKTEARELPQLCSSSCRLPLSHYSDRGIYDKIAVMEKLFSEDMI